MKKHELVESVALAEKAKGYTWEKLAAEVGMSPVWVTSVCLPHKGTINDE